MNDNWQGSYILCCRQIEIDFATIADFLNSKGDIDAIATRIFVGAKLVRQMIIMGVFLWATVSVFGYFNCKVPILPYA